MRRTTLWRGLLLGALIAAAQPALARDIRMSTTTSTENSGLLKVLLPAFEAKHGVKVHVISVGTGKALELHLAKLLVSREFDEYEKYLAADYTRINANGVVETREQVLAGFRGSTGEFSMQPTDLVVNIYGDTAILTGILTVVTAQSSRVSRFRKVFIRRDGRWFLVSLQGVTLPGQ